MWVERTRICGIHKRAVNHVVRVVTKAGIGRSVRGPGRGKLNLSVFCTGASAHFNNCLERHNLTKTDVLPVQ